MPNLKCDKCDNDYDPESGGHVTDEGDCLCSECVEKENDND